MSLFLISPKETQDYTVSPLTTYFPHVVPKAKISVDSLGAWESFTHPEGSLYYCHPSKRIWTNAYIHEQHYYREVEDCVTYLEHWRQCLQEDSNVSLPDGYELVIEIDAEKDINNKLVWRYYYVDHATRSVFWLANITLWEELQSVKGNLSPDHVYHKITQFYWHHVFHFPGGRRDLSTHFNEDHWNKLLSFMDFNALDTILSPRSTSLFSDTDLMRMKNIVKRALEQSKENALLPDQLSAVARIEMVMFEHRLLHAHGQPFARLHSNDSIYPEAGGPKPTSLLFRTVNLLLLRSPLSSLKTLQNILVDDIVLENPWRKHFERLLEDWDRLVLQGTVVLAANVSFLAIPDVIHFNGNSTGVGVRPQFSWSASLSYISTLFAIGSVVSGLLLARHNRSQVEQATDAAEACKYLDVHRSLAFGIEPMAIIYSLPYSLLLWGTGFFLAALLSFTFDGTDVVTRSIVVASASIVIGLLLWCTLSGKLMILNKIWVPFTQTDTFEWLVDTAQLAAKVSPKGRRKLSFTMAYLKRAAAGTDEAPPVEIHDVPV
ncbi:hypothetical protein PENSPDRAFT_680079 [Peniophora sp. CONT]|nr:hypothetical protein PENSPDRAFT_680079 [Peniophora sp. CONT]